jgi:branched-chain amino acid transport system substrate-binding protein
MQLRRTFLATVAAAGLVASVAGLASAPAMAQGQPVKIGELNSYSRFAAFAVPYRNGMQLAQEEINAKGGVLGGRKLEIVFRDDGSTPGDAVRVAEELLTRENVSFLAGTFLSNVGLAVADFANQKKTLFIATEPLTDAITMGAGNRYTFRVRPSTYMQTKMLVEAVKAKGVKKWAIVAPNYEYGQSAAANFKKLIKVGDARCRDRRRAVSGARQDRRRRHSRRAGELEARWDLQCAVRRRPHHVRARGQHPRPVREAHRGEPADRRA